MCVSCVVYECEVTKQCALLLTLSITEVCGPEPFPETVTCWTPARDGIYVLVFVCMWSPNRALIMQRRALITR